MSARVKDPKILFGAAPSLVRWKTLIRRALDAQEAKEQNREQLYVVAVPEQLPLAVDMAKRKAAVLLLVLPGPTPIEAKRVPASLILLPLDKPGNEDLSNPWLLLARACADAIGGAAERSDQQFVSTWRSLDLSCDAAGESETSARGGVDLEGVLSDRKHIGKEASGVWRGIEETSAEHDIAPEAVLESILTHNTVWFSPYTGQPVRWSEALRIFHTVQTSWQENCRASHCYGAQYWNHPSIRATFSGTGGEVSFHETQEEAIAAAGRSGGQILSWAGRTDAAFEEACSEAGIPLLRIEDGFLRSVGLGAGLARGAMLAVDDLGIYYDPSRPSRLEVLLKDYELSEAEQQRGKCLVELISAARVSKYNFGKSRSFSFPADRTTILIPGQVADDAAIRKSMSATIDCANTPNVNLDLLKLVRGRHPDAHLIFKPHPDVETGLRKGKVERRTALNYADEIAEDANIIDLIEAVDTVETFSSLSGFEALLRGRKVTVHGAPFYAGWGLCEDLTEIPGRGRARSLPELVYLALVKYARTVDPVSLLPCTPEFLVARLSEQRGDRKHLLVTALKRHSSWLGRKLGI
ncbi:capsular polysaccharide export protein, LipB/KpsS family [Roseibium marinum]|uniref:Capsular polysaccharide biosynthesis protein n=1 Tax=Roseibium marinum TaxID=281252 RepID=A0A2S3UNC4_9HYPH|nr:hypothetical protein [Roseibium marinum]POF29191.1 capsular polysaccharide biosynthesis protein [Roseibium marinum]